VKSGFSITLDDGSGVSTRGSCASSARALPASSAVAQRAALENRIAGDVQAKGRGTRMKEKQRMSERRSVDEKSEKDSRFAVGNLS
jgi:hypothetical protein